MHDLTREVVMWGNEHMRPVMDICNLTHMEVLVHGDNITSVTYIPTQILNRQGNKNKVDQNFLR